MSMPGLSLFALKHFICMISTEHAPKLKMEGNVMRYAEPGASNENNIENLVLWGGNCDVRHSNQNAASY